MEGRLRFKGTSASAAISWAVDVAVLAPNPISICACVGVSSATPSGVRAHRPWPVSTTSGGCAGKFSGGNSAKALSSSGGMGQAWVPSSTPIARRTTRPWVLEGSGNATRPS